MALRCMDDLGGVFNNLPYYGVRLVVLLLVLLRIGQDAELFL